MAFLSTTVMTDMCTPCRGEVCDAHIIVLTAEPWRDAINAISAVHVEPKPFDLDRFLSTIEYWCLAHVPQSD